MHFFECRFGNNGLFEQVLTTPLLQIMIQQEFLQ